MFLHEQLDPNSRFRERRRQARRRRRLRRAVGAGALAAIAAGLALGATFIGTRHPRTAAPATPPRISRPARPSTTPVPPEIRGVHVTMGLASLPGKLDSYVRLASAGLNTLELDVKDENGQVGFTSSGLPPLARRDGAARRFYDPRALARQVHAHHLYLIGRVVVFEDPVLAGARPDLALHDASGALWHSASGLAWANPYDRRVWAYDVGIATAAARAGFDEIQFDYVRFPGDGDLSRIVYPRRLPGAKGDTIAAFLRYAAARLHSLHVRVSADVFGLAATHDLGIGQVPRRIGRFLDAIHPMVYPSHYSSGEYGLADPSAYPGRTVAHSLLDFRRALRGEHVPIVPWLQDFTLGRPYTLIEVSDQVAAARRQHAAGFLLWNPEGVYTRDALSPSD
jgi:hypothetical protein